MNIDGAFPSKFLSATDLPAGKQVPVIIERVSVEDVGQGDQKSRKPILYFQGKQKGLVLNKTNANRISELTKSRETDDWIGWTIRLYATKVEFQGKRVIAIRVNDASESAQPPSKPRKANSRPVLESHEDDFDETSDAEDAAPEESMGEDVPF